MLKAVHYMEMNDSHVAVQQIADTMGITYGSGYAALDEYAHQCYPCFTFNRKPVPNSGLVCPIGRDEQKN